MLLSLRRRRSRCLLSERRWIACRTAFRGRHRQLLQPHSWTELFFLDEATAFASGHRPCAECRHADYQRFKAAWRVGVGTPNGADQMDAVLHADRLEGRSAHQRKRTYWEKFDTLPAGVFIRLDGSAWLLRRGQLLEWSAGGYRARRSLPAASNRVEVLTPSSLVADLRAGYQLQIHVSADETA